MPTSETSPSSHAQAAFPSATIVGYPRIGPNRELKKALESFWAGKITEEEMKVEHSRIRRGKLQHLADLGLDSRNAAIPDSSALYDHVLDTTLTLGAIPTRFRNRTGLDLEFAMARGDQDVAPLEMTKWFATNYHYLVPEINAETPIRLGAHVLRERFEDAKEWGIITRPVIVGPVTWLALAKSDGADVTGGALGQWSPFDRLGEVVNTYCQLLADLDDAGAPWIQLDEPALVSDTLGYTREQLRSYARQAYTQLSAYQSRPQLLVTTPYGDVSDVVADLARVGIEAIHLDLVAGKLPSHGVDLANTTLVAGVVDGKNIWRTPLGQAADTLQEALALNPHSLSVSTSTSTLHVPHTVADEHWDDTSLNTALHEWLAFADEKVREVITLARGVQDGWSTIDTQIAESRKIHEKRALFPGVRRADVREQQENVVPNDRIRVDRHLRKVCQQEKLSLPLLPTTTIGSFPQTKEIRSLRARWTRGDITDAEYTEALKLQIASVIHLQEEIGLDVLVHGEPERNDMVQYFAEQLDGFAVTTNGWVQSYGSRCTRPSILWGDVARRTPLTVPWASFAQSLTAKPVKAMLTGPTTILAWSFVRDDLPRDQVADQIALALRQEIVDLEAEGIPVIQVDEPGMAELVPLDAADQQEYLRWAVAAFRLATAGALPSTQIHTHLCYADYEKIIDAVIGLDADVTSMEAARSHLDFVPQLAEHVKDAGIGPGVWDIHSPRIPSIVEIERALRLAIAAIGQENVWVNPDCGLKTRGYAETVDSLKHLVAAAAQVREELHR